MYNITMLSPQTVSLLTKMSADFSSKPNIINMAIARAVSIRLPLPSAKLDTPSEFYDMQCLNQIKTLVSVMSDVMPFDTQTTFDMVETMWMVRYKSAYPSEIIFTSCTECGEASFFGYSTAIPIADLTFIKDNVVSLVLAYNNFCTIFKEIANDGVK